jgi:multicomponent Na+:H+ antiporter subunit A
MTVLMLLQIFLILLMVVAALASILYKDLLSSVIVSGFVSLAASLLFYFLQAPDVALTEAAIGTGLTTYIFVLTIRKTERFEK